MKISIGKKYEVEIFDCCVHGSFVSTIEKINGAVVKDNTYLMDDGVTIFFSNGVELSCHGGVHLTEV